MSKVAQRYLEVDPWQVIERGFHRRQALVSESVFSIANEARGVRGYFDEGYGGKSLRGAYCNGIFEEEPIVHPVLYKGMATRFHYLVNAVDWLWTRIELNGEALDLSRSKVSRFRRRLDFRTGVYRRTFRWHVGKGSVDIAFERSINMVHPERSRQRISIRCVNGPCRIRLKAALDFSPEHHRKGRNLWPDVASRRRGERVAIVGTTQHTKQRIAAAMSLCFSRPCTGRPLRMDKLVGTDYRVLLSAGECMTVDRLVSHATDPSSRMRPVALMNHCLGVLWKARGSTWESDLAEQREHWDRFWSRADVKIDGDPLNQQGVRFCMFQLHMTYHGVDPRNNIAAKGLTGEEYHGHTWWDTETYCLPFYLFTSPAAARNLLAYRYRTLPQAKERAAQLDCRGARFPMSTIDGTESCAVWQHGDLEIHVSAAVAYGIWNYVRVTGDASFLDRQGAEMLIEICRYYASRGAWSQRGRRFGIWFVMGPDEFHMAVNNNHYTNYMARFCFRYTRQVLADMSKRAPRMLERVRARTGLRPSEEQEWQQMSRHMILLRNRDTGLIEQHEGYFDLPHTDCAAIPPEQLPLYKHWAYYRIFRTDMTKQPDALLLPFFFSRSFSRDEKEVNYNYYEQRCSHESSLSPSIFSILAAELGDHERALAYWGHSARLDLDNFNRNSHEGLHTTSMAAAWMNVVYGFGGLRTDGSRLSLNPILPRGWNGYRFNVSYRGSLLEVSVTGTGARVSLIEGKPVDIELPAGRRQRVTGMKPGAWNATVDASTTGSRSAAKSCSG